MIKHDQTSEPLQVIYLDEKAQQFYNEHFPFLGGKPTHWLNKAHASCILSLILSATTCSLS